MTLLCDENLLLWFSELNWNSPSDGKKFQEDKWEYLGSYGWVINDKQRKRRDEILKMFVDQLGEGCLPEWHNEYCEID